MDRELEYWEVPSEGKEEDLDVELIRELNELDDETYSQGDSKENLRSTSFLFRIISLLTVAVFLFIFINSWIQFVRIPPLGFLKESSLLAGDPEIKGLREAVVKVSAGTSRGTGFNIDVNGLIITNYHVIKNKKKVQVNFSDSPMYNSLEVITFPQFDLAVIRINGDNLPVLELAPQSNLQIGEEVTIIGNPLGFFRVVQKSKVEGFTRLDGWKEPVVVLEGPVYKGNSGSPVFNSRGQVIAVVFASITEGEGQEEVISGLAVPIDHLKQYLNN